MNAPSTSSNSGTQGRQKRVLPSRSRRGGPGVGNCDADLMILETQKRRFENEPLIPVDTKFLLTTDSSLAAESCIPSELGFNSYANDRYFDKPEVLKAYREQKIIQTPEFINVADTLNVGGRFRPRDSEDGTADTSDAAYEKRHRKYETFEKRQRLREKEKLKHEQYKLKERIEQLRVMDGAAFLSLPASAFSSAPGQSAGDSEDGSSGVQINDAANEGERRRKEMLDMAMVLEGRYRVLLPPEKLKKLASNTASPLREPETSMRNSNRQTDEEESETDKEPSIEVTKKQFENLKLKIKFPGRSTISQGHPSPSTTRSTSSKKRRSSDPPPSQSLPITHRMRNSQASAPSPSSSQRLLDIDGASTSSLVNEFTPLSPPPSLMTRTISITPQTPMSSPDIAVLENQSRDATIAPDDEATTSQPHVLHESIPAVHRYKRIKLSPSNLSARNLMRVPSMPPIESISTPVIRKYPSRLVTTHSPTKKYASHASVTGPIERTTGVLMVAALRRSQGPKAHKQMRHLKAFGTKVPPEVDQLKEFELPPWVLPYESGGSQASVNGHEIARALSTGTSESLAEVRSR